MFDAPDGPPELVTHLLDLIRGTANSAPRSQQKVVGPSELGQACTRRLALKLLGADEVNTGADRWPATIGSAVHAWLADALLADNERLEAAGEPPRWLVEQRVTVRPGLTGSCDAYDLYTNTVIDWKCVGTTSLRKYKKEGPGPQYRAQAHLYGMGWANAGLPVRNVALVFLPRAGMLPDTHHWQETFNPQVAHDALNRMDQLLVGMNMAEAAGSLEQFLQLVDRDTSMCSFCPYFSLDTGVAPTQGCCGVLENTPKTPGN